MLSLTVLILTVPSVLKNMPFEWDQYYYCLCCLHFAILGKPKLRNIKCMFMGVTKWKLGLQFEFLNYGFQNPYPQQPFF